MGIIELKGINKQYHVGDHYNEALKNVDLDIEDGEFVVILGPSGCGKTTLLNLIGGIDFPTSGEVIVDGEKIDYQNEKYLTEYRKDKIGFIFQFFNLIDDLTVYQNINIISYNKERSLKLLEYVGLLDKQNDYPRNLSGGQMQKVSIARALNKESKILLCDEPTGALDEENTKLIIELIKKIHQEEHMTIILVTHNELLSSYASLVLKMRDGRIIEKIRPNAE